MMQYVEVRELLAWAQDTYYIMIQLAIFFYFMTSAVNVLESVLSEARQHPGVPGEAIKLSSRLRISLLEDRCMLECIHCRCERIKEMCDHYW